LGFLKPIAGFKGPTSRRGEGRRGKRRGQEDRRGEGAGKEALGKEGRKRKGGIGGERCTHRTEREERVHPHPVEKSWLCP